MTIIFKHVRCSVCRRNYHICSKNEYNLIQFKQHQGNGNLWTVFSQSNSQYIFNISILWYLTHIIGWQSPHKLTYMYDPNIIDRVIYIVYLLACLCQIFLSTLPNLHLLL